MIVVIALGTLFFAVGPYSYSKETETKSRESRAIGTEEEIEIEEQAPPECVLLVGFLFLAPNRPFGKPRRISAAVGAGLLFRHQCGGSPHRCGGSCKNPSTSLIPKSGSQEPTLIVLFKPAR